MKEGVFDAGKPRRHAALEHDHVLGPVRIENRHAVDRRCRIRARRGIHHVVRADDECHVRLRKLPVDLVHVVEPVVRYVRLGQQHVHVARHAPRDRMDGVLHLTAALLDQLGQLAHRVLRLRHRHAVARDDDHALRVRELHGGVLRRDGPHGERRAGRHCACRGAAAERAEEHVRERAVHRLRHRHGEQEARRAVQRAADDQDAVAQREAGGRRGEPAIGVQQRNHHRHVRPADRDHHQHAQHRGERDHSVQRDRQRRIHDHGDEEPDRAGEQQRVHEVLPLVGDGLRREDLLELAERHQRAGDRERTEQHLEAERRHARRRDEAVAPMERRVVLGHADERRGERTKAQRHGDPLRKRRRRHPHAERIPDERAEHEAGDDPPVVDDVVVDERAADGHQHAERGVLHAAPRAVRVRQTAQSEDEED